MLHLNLVSEKLKKEIRLRRIYDILKFFNLTLVLATIVIAIAIITAKIILQNNFNKVVEQTTLITKNSQGRNTEIREINQKLNYIFNIQDDFLRWTFLFDHISDFSKEGMTFKTINIKKEDKTIEFRGVANIRDDLIFFKEGLEVSPIFNNIDFPMSNILEKENISFSIDAEIDLEEIKKLEQ